MDANGWHGYNLELRTPPPTHSNGSTTSSSDDVASAAASANGHRSRKRGWEEVATPVHDFQSTAWPDSFDAMTDASMSTLSGVGFVTPDFSQNGDGSITFDAGDGVEEIPRTKMQTGCIPCL